MKDKIDFVCRWIKWRYYYCRFLLTRNTRKKYLWKLATKQAFKSLYVI